MYSLQDDEVHRKGASHYLTSNVSHSCSVSVTRAVRAEAALMEERIYSDQGCALHHTAHIIHLSFPWQAAIHGDN